MAQRAITVSAAQAAAQQHGIAHAQCMEGIFGARVRTSFVGVVWVGPRDGFRLETSIDGGTSWQEVHEQGPIPGLVEGTPVVHMEVLTRILLLDHLDTVLITSIFTIVVLGDPAHPEQDDVIFRNETGLGLNSGSMTSILYDPMRNGLAAKPELTVEFRPGTSGYGTSPFAPHNADTGAAEGVHISHGKLRTLTFNQHDYFFEMQDLNDDDHKEKAACAIEVWVYPTEVTDVATILSWATHNVNGNGGTIPGCWLRVRPKDGGAQVFFEVHTSLSGSGLFENQKIIAPVPIPLNKWSQISLSYEGYRAFLLLNQVVSMSQTLYQVKYEATRAGPHEERQNYGLVIPTDGNFFVGCDPITSGTVAGQFRGRISEIRLYAKALTGSYLKARRRLLPPDVTALTENAGLREYWPLNEGTGDVLFGKVKGIPLTIVNMNAPDGPHWQPSYETFLGRPYIVELENGRKVTQYAPARVSPPMHVESSKNFVRITNAPFNVTFPDGRLFLGIGQYAGMDAIQEPTEISPTGINVSFTALDQSLVAIAMNALYLDGPLRVYEVYFDEDDELVQDPVLIFGGLMDSINIRAGKEPTVVVSAESQLRNWQRSSIIKWNDEGHRALYPEDFGLEFVGRTVDQVVWWPRKTTEKFDPGDVDTDAPVETDVEAAVTTEDVEDT